MYSNNREAYRKAFYESWQKHLNQLPLEPVEAQLVEIIKYHPEYEKYLSATQLNEHYEIEENPFVHMSLHLAIREQIHLNQPHGILEIFNILKNQGIAHHDIEHQMMTCLGQFMWQAQQDGTTPSEENYIEALKTLLSDQG